MAIAVSGQWTRLRTLGRGASGAVVSLAADGASGELFAVKSVAAADAALLSREQGIMSSLCSPDVVRCLGGAHRDDGSYHLFLEFAPGGSLADEVARNGGRLEERTIRAYAADVLGGLAYVHGESLVHGDIKSRNIVIGADGRAKIADFGCARTAGSDRPIGGTPAFMAPEVARGEEQGPAADVWALGCTVVEMATGRAPWSNIDNVLAAVHWIGYTDAVPEVPAWLSPEAKDFLAACFTRNARDRRTAAELLEHPFLALQEAESNKARWVSPKSTLDAAFWESESDDEDEKEISENASERIKSLSCSISASPEWDSDEGWIDVLGGERCDDALDSPATEEPADLASRAPGKLFGSVAMPAEDMAVVGGLSSDEQLDAGEQPPFGGDILADDHSTRRITDHENKVGSKSDREIHCNRIDAIEKFRFPHKMLSRSDNLSSIHTMFWTAVLHRVNLPGHPRPSDPGGLLSLPPNLPVPGPTRPLPPPRPVAVGGAI
ncbi:mitogen-activated protein kinase kinase kinase 18-like [Lolium rigidum]|uniref:mitogen-activated protein kinase kinase kinase 18-like n=1 Tax=Lolium rigidum TaxID=89674 RepID=UPI001F5D6AFC|nr:mitogen-activated protein kinase kinase kinase 18-like [Lolium rigidum]